MDAVQPSTPNSHSEPTSTKPVRTVPRSFPHRPRLPNHATNGSIRSRAHACRRLAHSNSVARIVSATKQMAIPGPGYGMATVSYTHLTLPTTPYV